MSESAGSYASVIICAIVLGALSVLLWLWGDTNTVEKILIIASVFFCLFLLFKQRWALIGISITLLLGIVVYFIQTWLQPIRNEDTALIFPNLVKMLIGIVFLILLGRQSVEDRLS
jgi:hypothetical protein